MFSLWVKVVQTVTEIEGYFAHIQGERILIILKLIEPGSIPVVVALGHKTKP